jgi:HK97 family phage major capsid protein
METLAVSVEMSGAKGCRNILEGNTMTTVKLLKDFDHGEQSFKKGKVLEISNDDFARKMIEDGVAEEWSETTDDANTTISSVGEKASVSLQDARDAMKEAINEAMKDAELVRKTVPRVEIGEPEAKKDPTGGFKSFGHFMLGIKGIRTGSPSPEMLQYVKFTAGHMEEGIDSQGGFLSPETYLATLLEIMHEEGQVTSRCREIPITGQLVKVPAIDETSRALGSRYGGTRGYTIAEGEQFTLSNTKLRLIKLEPSKKGTITYASDELNEGSAFAIGQLILGIAGQELAFIMDNEVINGTGAAEALGVLNAPATVSQAKETGQAATTIVYENIVKMWSRMFARSRPNSVFFINQSIEPELFTMALNVGTGGAPAYLPANGLSSTPFATLMGRPVVPIEQCAALGTVGDIILADMSQYLLGVKSGGVRTAVSEHLRFDYEQNAYRASVRFDGQPWWNNALTPFKDTTKTQSPFVTLATRS